MTVQQLRDMLMDANDDDIVIISVDHLVILPKDHDLMVIPPVAKLGDRQLC